MRLADRYVLRELVVPFLAGTVGFVAMVLAKLIVSSSATIFNYDTPWRETVRWLALRTPVILTWAMPVGILLAVALLVLRLGHHNEITAFRMGGLPAGRLFAPLWATGMVVAAAALVNGELISPPLARRANALLSEVILHRGQNPVKDNATFTAGGDTFCHVSRVDRTNKVLVSVLIYRLQQGLPAEALSAPECVWTPGGWELRGGRRYQFDEQGVLVASEPFEVFPVAFADDLEELWDEDKDPDELTIRQVYRRLRLHEAAGDQVNAAAMRFYLHRKFAVPFTCPVFVLVAVAMCLPSAKPGQQPVVGVLLTIVVVFFCNGTMNWAKTIALSGPGTWLPPALAAWLHVLVFGAIGVIMLRRAEL